MMGESTQKKIDESRAAVLLGLTRDQLRRLGENSCPAYGESGESCGHRVFTYEELYRLCRLAVQSAE
jgi:hypothetical protein